MEALQARVLTFEPVVKEKGEVSLQARMNAESIHRAFSFRVPKEEVVAVGDLSRREWILQLLKRECEHATASNVFLSPENILEQICERKIPSGQWIAIVLPPTGELTEEGKLVLVATLHIQEPSMLSIWSYPIYTLDLKKFVTFEKLPPVSAPSDTKQEVPEVHEVHVANPRHLRERIFSSFYYFDKPADFYDIHEEYYGVTYNTVESMKEIQQMIDEPIGADPAKWQLALKTKLEQLWGPADFPTDTEKASTYKVLEV
jgi:hypothetical protein